MQPLPKINLYYIVKINKILNTTWNRLRNPGPINIEVVSLRPTEYRSLLLFKGADTHVNSPRKDIRLSSLSYASSTSCRTRVVCLSLIY